MRHFATVAMVISLLAAPLSGADARAVRAGQNEEAPVPVQDVNPSKAEPMMIGPTQDQDAANYRRDFVACDLQAGQAREACRDTVDEEYRPDVTNLSGHCEALEGTAKAECLRSNGPEK